MTLRLVGAAVLFALAGCLEPLVRDDLAPEKVFGQPPEIHLEDDPLLRARALQFSQRVQYLFGYADQNKVWYWNVDGPNSRVIAPVFIVKSDSGQVGRPIVDVIPGDIGYTPWWRIVEVKTTASYAGENIWSREAIDVGVRIGILSPPVETRDVIDAPIVVRETTVPIGCEPAPCTSKTATSTPVWYRNRLVDWVRFKQKLDLDVDRREMPLEPVYVLQRIDEGAPIYEAVTGVDLNGDGVLNASNNIFAGNIGTDDYTPIWNVVFVRTAADFVSIDTSSVATPEVRSEEELLDARTRGRVLSIDPVVPDALVNCPIQSMKGSL